MSDEISPFSLTESLTHHTQSDELPPVHRWNPPFCGEIDLRVARDGRWYYQGSEITRLAMVRLFSRVLRRDDDDAYYLVTPVEKVKIQVDDAPFLIISADQQVGEQGVEYRLTTQTGDHFILGKAHPMWVLEDADSGEPSPYVCVRDRLNGLIHRNVFYELVSQAKEQPTNSGVEWVIHSQGCTFSLGEIVD